MKAAYNDRLRQREQELSQKINRLTMELRQVHVALLIGRKNEPATQEDHYVPCR